MSKYNTKNSDILPYDKCLIYGPECLSTTEILAIILRTGSKKANCMEVADRLLRQFGADGILGLKHASINELTDIEGIGKVKAVLLQCIAELSRRIYNADRKFPSRFTNSSEVAAYYMEDLRHLEKEQFRIMLLDVKCNLLHEAILSMGTVNFTCISARDVFKCALNHNAVYVIMVHNHPSGNPAPSREDINTTDRIVKAGEIIGITLADHVIIGDNRYFSFKEHNMLN